MRGLQELASVFDSPRFNPALLLLGNWTFLYRRAGRGRVNGEPIRLVVLRWSGESIWIRPESKKIRLVRRPSPSQEHNAHAVAYGYAAIHHGSIFALSTQRVVQSIRMVSA